MPPPVSITSSDLDVAVAAGPEDQLAAVGHGELGVADQVQQGLLERVDVQGDRRQVGGALESGDDPLGERLRLAEVADVLDDGVQVGRRPGQAADADEAEEVLEDALEPVGLACGPGRSSGGRGGRGRSRRRGSPRPAGRGSAAWSRAGCGSRAPGRRRAGRSRRTGRRSRGPVGSAAAAADRRALGARVGRRLGGGGSGHGRVPLAGSGGGARSGREARPTRRGRPIASRRSMRRRSSRRTSESGPPSGERSPTAREVVDRGGRGRRGRAATAATAAAVAARSAAGRAGRRRRAGGAWRTRRCPRPPLGQGRLAGELDAVLLVDGDDLDEHRVADPADVGDAVDVAVGQLADVDQAVLAGEDLDEGAEVLDGHDAALVDLADLDALGHRLDPVAALLGAGGRRGWRW